jgi:hypothetical protein
MVTCQGRALRRDGLPLVDGRPLLNLGNATGHEPGGSADADNLWSAGNDRVRPGCEPPEVEDETQGSVDGAELVPKAKCPT